MSDIQLPGAQASLTADASQFEAGIGRAQQALMGLEPVVARQWWGLQNLGRAFGAVSTTITAAFGTAVNEAIAWESAMTGVQRTTGATGTELAAIERSLRDVANTTPIAAGELAGLAEEAAALGISNTDLPEFTRLLGILLTSTNLTTSSVEDLGRTLNVLQVPVQAFERFGSTLIEVGRNTASTETEILDLARRLAPTAKTAGFTADEVLALSAAITSLGSRAQAGGTAAAKTISDMASAIGEGSEKLALFASVTGDSIEEFATKFRQEPAQAFAAFVTGLGRMNGGMVEATQLLSDLGIEEVRQRQALLGLAEGAQATGSEQSDLNAILAMSQRAWRENVAIVEVAERRFKTTASQLQIMRNRLSEAADIIGRKILPVINFLVGLIQDFAAGFAAVPTAVQVVIASFIALIGIVSGLAAGFVALVGPVVLAMQTLRTLTGITQGVDAHSARATGSIGAMNAVIASTAAESQLAAFGLNRMAAAELAVASGARTVAASQGAATASNAALAGTSVSAATASTRLVGILGRVARVAGVVGGIISVAAVAMTLFGGAVRRSKDETEKKVEADLALVDAIDQQARGLSKAADDWILQQALMAGVTEAATRLKISLAEVVALISGRMDTSGAQMIIDRLSTAAEAGDEGAESLLRWMSVTQKVFVESAAASGHLTTARNDLGHATEDAADAERDLASSTEDARKKQDDINQAIYDYIGALLDQRTAVLDVKKAQEEYQKVLADADDPARRIQRAELQVQRARLSHEKAIRNLRDAEIELERARENQLDDLRDAEERLLDTQDRYQDSLEKISDLEEKIAEVRSGPSARELLEATNKLIRAQDRLQGAHQSVADAEWYLNYLRQEGASDRDIRDAEEALQDARDEVSFATEDVAEAEEGLNDLRDESKRQEELAALERDLEQARRDSESALRDIYEQERNVADLREDVANDTAYRDAQAELVDAQLAVEDALNRVRDAELELQRLRAGGIQDDLARAQIDLERALIRAAEANAEARRQQALMNGEFWDAGHSAHALADELSKLLDAAPNAEARRRLEEYIAILRRAVPGAGPTAPAQPAQPTTQPITVPDPNLDFGNFDGSAQEGAGSWWERFTRFLDDNSVGGAIGGVIGGVLGSALGPLGTILGGLIGTAIGSLAQHVYPSIFGFFKEVGGKIYDLAPGLFDGIGKALSGWPGAILSYKPEVLRSFGGFMYDVVDTVSRVIGGLPGTMLTFLGAIGTTALVIGKELLYGVYLGMTGQWTELWNWFQGLPGRIWDAIPDPIKILFNAGKNILIGLWNGIVDWFNSNFVDKWNNLISFLPGAIEDKLKIGSPSKVFEDIGRAMMLGLAQGIESNISAIHAANQKVTAATSLDLASQFGNDFRDFALHQVNAGAFAASPQAVTNNNGDKIEINGADNRDAMEIADEIMFRKLIRSR